MRFASLNSASRRRRTRLNWQVQVVVTILLGLTLAGCAISPQNGVGQGTVLKFTVTLNAPIQFGSPNIYAIVMYLGQGSSTPAVPVGNDIAPVVGTSTTGNGTSPNGMFVGLATNALIIQNVNSGTPVGIYYFGATPVDTPRSLGIPIGTTNDTLSLDQGGDYGNVLTFTVFLSQLQPVDTQSYKWIRFQVLTMSTLSISGAGSRTIDALGISPSFSTTPWTPINRSNPSIGAEELYPEGLAEGTTPKGGDQSLAIQSVSLGVSAPGGNAAPTPPNLRKKA